MPVFQNKAYSSKYEAINAKCGDVTLRKCDVCGHVWNSSFNPELLDFDENYQNEQGLSQIFSEHLETVSEILKRYLKKEDHIIEIGCGKAKFLMMMADCGYMVHGYDPAYEGNDSRILKSYYPPHNINNECGVANLIILRCIELYSKSYWIFTNYSKSKQICGVIVY